MPQWGAPQAQPRAPPAPQQARPGAPPPATAPSAAAGRAAAGALGSVGVAATAVNTGINGYDATQKLAAARADDVVTREEATAVYFEGTESLLTNLQEGANGEDVAGIMEKAWGWLEQVL